MTKQGITNAFWGGVVGAGVVIVVAFAAGLVVTSGKSERLIIEARVDQLAEFCAQAAQAHRAQTGDTTALAGYEARTVREALAATYAIMPWQTEAESSVVRACAIKLNA